MSHNKAVIFVAAFIQKFQSLKLIFERTALQRPRVLETLHFCISRQLFQAVCFMTFLRHSNSSAQSSGTERSKVNYLNFSVGSVYSHTFIAETLQKKIPASEKKIIWSSTVYASWMYREIDDDQSATGHLRLSCNNLAIFLSFSILLSIWCIYLFCIFCESGFESGLESTFALLQIS